MRLAFKGSCMWGDEVRQRILSSPSGQLGGFDPPPLTGIVGGEAPVIRSWPWKARVCIDIQDVCTAQALKVRLPQQWAEQITRQHRLPVCGLSVLNQQQTGTGCKIAVEDRECRHLQTRSLRNILRFTRP